MGFDFTGHVLRAPRNAPGNSATSSPADNGVVRDVRIPPGTRTAAQPTIVDYAGDQYRAAILEAPGTSPHEYLVWAAFSSQIAMREDPSWWQEGGSGRIPVGALTVGSVEDGTLKVIVTDLGGRQIGLVTHLVIARGDVDYEDGGWVDANDPDQGRLGTAPYPVVKPTVADFDSLSGIVTLTDDNVFEAPAPPAPRPLVASDLATLFDGGLSLERGDHVVSVRYTLAAQKFWWTRNDRYETRFGWNNESQRWMPFKGSAPVNLGTLLYDETYRLAPPFSNLPVGSVLPGDALVGDGYAMIRLGSSAGATSLPVGVNDLDGFTGIIVVADAEVESQYEFSGTSYAGVVGQTSGRLQFNPLFVEQHAGTTIWYVYRGFSSDSDGLVGQIDDEDLFLAPVPGPTDHPFVRINNRTPLTVILAATEAEMTGITPAEGECVIALTTGRLKLSVQDRAKADPRNLAAFNKHFLGARVLYDGVALNATPQPVRGPQALVQADGLTTVLHPSGRMFLPPSKPWPEDMVGADEQYAGLGLSGVLHLPDGTGAVPDPEGVNPALVTVPVRPGGDTLVGPPQTLGLIRQIEDGVGDTFLFSKNGAVSELVVVDRNSEMPSLVFDISADRAYIARESTILGGVPHAQVQLGAKALADFGTDPVYFVQASLNPATYTERAILYSKARIVFRFDGDETLYFAVDGTPYTWTSSTLLAALPDNEFFTADEVATSINLVMVGPGSCVAVGDRVALLADDPNNGVVEIGWGDPKDLSGAAALGLLPGWRVEGGKPNWLSDAGISLGLARSLLNLDRSKPDSDYYARQRVEDVVLAESVQPSPFVFLDFPPVEDVAGFDEGTFFNLQTVALNGDELRVIDQRLGHFEEVHHRFGERKVAWLGTSVSSNQVQQRTSVINLGHPVIVPESLLGAPGINGGFLAADDGARYVLQQEGIDYLFTDNGDSGTTQLITRFGARVDPGARGTFTQGGTTFEDPAAAFDRTLKAGDRITLSTGDAAGTYIVQSVTDATHCEVHPPFIANAGRATPWEAFSGYSDSVYDPGIIADQVYKPFNHLESEPFQIRVLSPLGLIAPTTVDFLAYIEDANASGRPISLRFGPVHPGVGVVATLNPVALTALGVLANNQLLLPASTHVSEGAFDILVGTERFVQGVGLLPVVAFSNDPVAVEYLTAPWVDGNGRNHPAGELKFNSNMLIELESCEVTLTETLRSSANLGVGQAEYDPKTGDVRISDADAITHAGKQLYLVEQMITEEPGADVKVSPLLGAVSFRKPVKKGSLVEMQYWRADSEGRRIGNADDTIVEFLPVFVSREVATRVSDHRFNLDPNGEHVLALEIEPLVYVGPQQQNYAGVTDFTVTQDVGLNGFLLTFNRDLPAWATPVVTYAIYDALGGERAYTTSTQPVYRPPFFIKADKDNFGLRGNRIAEFQIGQMLRVGSDCFYVTQLRYFPTSNVTRVDIYPPTAAEVGSRSPGNDVLTLITAGPITPEVNYQGTLVPTAAPQGFMQDVVGFEFEPVYANQNSITFKGDLTAFAVPGHIMEVANLPLTIATVDLSEDGTRTKITFTTAFRTGVDPVGNPTVRLSYRPVYPPNVRQFLGIGPFIASEGVALTLFGEFKDGLEQPGRRLAQGTEFEIDPETGVVQLLDPLQEPLGPGQKLLLSFTRIRVLEPFYQGGRLQYPRWAAKYKHLVIPNEGNGILGGTLTATYTFDNPDSFYYRALPLRSYLSEAVQEAVQEMKQGQSAGGPQLSVIQGSANWDRGNLGLASQRRDLIDKDRAARIMLAFYNDTVQAFEQVDETITGKMIGDRDGKFRFWVGRGREYAPPGYEDPITGELNPTNVWTQVYNEGNPAQDIWFNPSIDPLVQPSTATMADLRLFGFPFSPHALAKNIRRQRELIRNDVDDVVLLGAASPTFRRLSSYPWFVPEAQGLFDRMGGVHQFSRMFPTSTRVLFTLQPGVGADLAAGNVGVYTWGRVDPTTGEVESTHSTEIGHVANPVMGTLTNVSQSALRERLPRARIFAYLPEGLPAGALDAGGPLPVADVNRPCLLVSQVPLSDLPIDPATGYPDVSTLLSQGGTTADVEAGDPDLSLPGFVPGQKIAWGQPDGKLYKALFPEELDLFGNRLFTGVFVDQVLHGCLLTLKDRRGNAITNPYDLLVASEANAGIAAHVFGIGRDDTVYVVPPDADNPIISLADSPSMETIQASAELLPIFRQGFDLSVATDGRVLDTSMPSWQDPFLFPVKEMAGQRTPTPMSSIEGRVDFANVSLLPLSIPALQGRPYDDSGDQQIPFLKGTNTELDRFDEIGNLLGPLMATVSAGGGAYPDEIVFADGELVSEASVIAGAFYKEPATLLTNTRTDLPLAFGQTPAREGDLVLLEVDPGAITGWMGFLSVGRIRSQDVGGGNYWSWIEPPRFVTQVDQGAGVRYLINNYAVHTTPNDYPVNPQVTNPSGLRLFGDVAGSRLILSFQDVPLALNNGNVVNTGNLNTIWAADPNNVVTIKLLSRPDDTAVDAPGGAGTFGNPDKGGSVLLSIRITATSVTYEAFDGTVFGPYLHGGATSGGFDPIGGEPVPGTAADSRHIILSGLPAGGLDFYAPAFGTEATWFLPHDRFDPAGPNDRRISRYGWEFAVDIGTDTGQSLSAYIDSDRLTFHEVLDFRYARPRGFALIGNPNGAPVYETSLRVTQVEIGAGGFSTVNDVTGAPLTFESREETGPGPHSSIQGTWNPGILGTEEGSVRVMAFETGNTPITGVDIVASVVCSQPGDSGGTLILEGDGTAERNAVWQVIPAGGAIANVEKGDLLYIDRAATTQPHTGAEKVGSYVVRYAVSPDAPNPWKAVSVSSRLGAGGFILTPFPLILNVDIAGNRLEIDDYSMLPPTGKVYIPLDESIFASATNLVEYRAALVSVEYTGFDLVGPNPKLVLNGATWRWAEDTLVVVPVNDINTAQVIGKRLSWHDNSGGGVGIMELDVSIRGGVLPDDSSVVGHHNPGTSTYGFANLTFESVHGTTTVLPAALVVGAAPAAGQVGADPATVHLNHVFDPGNDVPVYPNVPAKLYVYVSNGQGAALYDPSALGVAAGMATLLSGTEVRTEDAGGAPGFYAQGGVFVEPSTPLYPSAATDISPVTLSGGVNVVDRSRSMNADEVGMRNPGTPEPVHFEVRRVRRWHGVQNGLNEAFAPLRLVYEIRRGIVDAAGYSRNPQQVGTLTATNFTMSWAGGADVWNTGESGLFGTNLGGFNDPDVNIHPGDILRILADDNATVLGEGVIAEVVDDRTLKVAAPGIPELTVAQIRGKRFEIFLRRAPVPHEQTNEQLLDLITDRVVFESFADRSDPDPQNWTGGYVPEVAVAGVWEDIANRLYDDSPSGVDFVARGVRAGDIVIVDPAGTMPVVDERGSPPIGDRSVPTRTVSGIGAVNPYTAGAVSALDDNRGFYRVASVNAGYLEVDPVHGFAGTLGQDVVFGESQPRMAYAIYPTISSSLLNASLTGEGQNDLRPTRRAVGTSFSTGVPIEDAHSIRPFSYRIIRPTTMFSAGILDMVLMLRERMLSLIELLRGAANGAKGGYYWDWQDEEHVEDLGTPTDPYSGLGLFPNRLLTSLVGEVSVSPFANTSGCLSLLDRRFWVLDNRLDSREPDPTNPYAMREVTGAVVFPDQGGPYTAYTNSSNGGSEVRPVLLDHLRLILDQRERLRAIRFTWLAYRTHRYIGTLARIAAFDAALPSRLEERQRLSLLEQTAEDVT